MVAGKLTGPLTKREYNLLRVLRWYRMHAPDKMTPTAWRQLGEFESRIQRFQRMQLAEHAKRWGKGLTRAKVLELERKVRADVDLTHDEIQQWIAAVELSKPKAASEADWERWDNLPVANSLFDRCRQQPRTRIVCSQPRRRTSRSRRASGTSTSPSGRPRPSGDDPDPSPIASSRGSGRALPRALRASGKEHE
jgi:hypothetical protein